MGCGVTIHNHNSQASLVSAVGWHPIIQPTFVSSQPTLLCWFWWGRTLAGHSVLPTSRYPDIGGCLWQTPFSAVWCRAYAGRRSRPTYFSRQHCVYSLLNGALKGAKKEYTHFSREQSTTASSVGVTDLHLRGQVPDCGQWKRLVAEPHLGVSLH